MALSLLLCAMPLAAGAEETVTLYWWFRGNGEQADTELVNAKVNEMLKSYEGWKTWKSCCAPSLPPIIKRR